MMYEASGKAGSCRHLFGRLLAVLFLYTLYLVFGPLRAVEAELVNEVIWLVAVPAVLLVLTLQICTLSGLLLRRLPRFSRWWMSNPFIPIAGVLLGVLILTVADPKSTAGSVEAGSFSYSPNYYLLAAGWILTAFCAWHFSVGSMVKYLKGKRKHQER